METQKNEGNKEIEGAQLTLDLVSLLDSYKCLHTKENTAALPAGLHAYFSK